MLQRKTHYMLPPNRHHQFKWDLASSWRPKVLNEINNRLHYVLATVILLSSLAPVNTYFHTSFCHFHDFISTCALIPRWHIPHRCHWNCPSLGPTVCLLLRSFHPETNSRLATWAGFQTDSWRCPSPPPPPCPQRQHSPGRAGCRCCPRCPKTRSPPRGFRFLVSGNWLRSRAWSVAKLGEDRYELAVITVPASNFNIQVNGVSRLCTGEIGFHWGRK